MMIDAPERIYAWVYRDGDRMHHNWRGSVTPCGLGQTEYIRADLATPLDDPRVLAVVEALRGLQQFFAMPYENSIGRFDRLAEQYRRETGNWPPGKSIPDAYNDSTDCETRRKEYDDWVQSKVDQARAALSALEENK